MGLHVNNFVNLKIVATDVVQTELRFVNQTGMVAIAQSFVHRTVIHKADNTLAILMVEKYAEPIGSEQVAQHTAIVVLTTNATNRVSRYVRQTGTVWTVTNTANMEFQLMDISNVM